MNTFILSHVSVIFFILLCSNQASAFLVQGTVIDTFYGPVPHAMVTITSESNPEFTFSDTTDEDGTYQIEVREPDIEIPKQFQLVQNWPNPFNVTTRLGYILDKRDYIRLDIFNILGQKIKVLDKRFRDPGFYVFTWDGCDDHGIPCSSGIYLYSLRAGGREQVKKMVLLDGGESYSRTSSFTGSGALYSLLMGGETEPQKLDYFYTIEVTISWLSVYKVEYEEISQDMLYDIEVYLQQYELVFFDLALESAVRRAISKPDGPILLPDVTDLTSLTYIGTPLKYLYGIDQLTSLTDLRIERSQVSDLTPLTGLTSLTRLILVQNDITDVSPLSRLTSLTHLDIYDNKISDISSLSGLTSLTILNINHNQISDISPVANLTKLTALGIEGNKIGDISPVSNLTELSWLICSVTDISDLSPVSNLTSLKTLYSSCNRISDISPLENLTALTALVLDHNDQISDITVLANCIELEMLIIGSNQIEDISSLSNLTSLTHLDLGINQISDISALSILTSLTWLSLRFNQITDISPLSNLTAIIRLNLNNNQINDISPLSEYTSLEKLYLNNNLINDISPLSNLFALEDIELSNNQVSDISALVANSGIGSGDSVDLYDNPLSEEAISTQIPALRERGVNVRY